MVISLRPPRRKITCGNWNNTNIHIDWKCMKQPMWEVPAFWLTKIAYIMFGLLHQSLWIGEKSYIFPHHHDPSADRRSDAPTPKNRFKQDPIAWPLDPLTPWPLDPLTPWPLDPSPSSHPHHRPWQKFGGRNFVNKEDVLLTILFQGFCSVRRHWAVPLMNGISKCVGNKSGTYGMLKSVWQSSIWIHLAHLREYVALFWSSIFGTAILGVSLAHASHWPPLWSPSQALMSFALWAQSPEVTISHISKPYLPINSQCVYIHVYVYTYIYTHT